MPQLDITTFSSQIFWLGLCFFVLVFFSSTVTLPRLRKVIEQRFERITGTQNASEGLQKKAEEIMKLYEEEITKARKQAQEHLLKNSRQQALAHSEERFRIGGEIKKHLKEKEAFLIQHKTSSSQETKKVAEQVAAHLVEHLMKGGSHV